MLHCPFCSAPETDRLELEGQRIVIFQCLFSPAVDATLTDEEIARHLEAVYADQGDAYFRGVCNALHVYVTKGEGARVLQSRSSAP